MDELQPDALDGVWIGPEETEPVAPRWGTRGQAPGERGCWATKVNGQPCAAARRNDSDYCNAHHGAGLAADPLAASLRGRVASAQARRRRADLRLALGATRLDSPRGALRAAAWVEARAIAERTIGAILDPKLSPEATVKAALAVLDAIDPVQELTLTGELDPSAVEALSWSELQAAAERLGLQASPG